jgi:hypothetical protein
VRRNRQQQVSELVCDRAREHQAGRDPVASGFRLHPAIEHIGHRAALTGPNRGAHHLFLAMPKVAGLERQKDDADGRLAIGGLVRRVAPLERHADLGIDTSDLVHRLPHDRRRRAGGVEHLEDECGGNHVRHRCNSTHSSGMNRR